jgi:hypothetical protein
LFVLQFGTVLPFWRVMNGWMAYRLHHRINGWQLFKVDDDAKVKPHVKVLKIEGFDAPVTR